MSVFAADVMLTDKMPCGLDINQAEEKAYYEKAEDYGFFIERLFLIKLKADYRDNDNHRRNKKRLRGIFHIALPEAKHV